MAGKWSCVNYAYMFCLLVSAALVVEQMFVSKLGSAEWLSGRVIARDIPGSKVTSLSVSARNWPAKCCANTELLGVVNPNSTCVNFSQSSSLPDWTAVISNTDDIFFRGYVTFALNCLPYACLIYLFSFDDKDGDCKYMYRCLAFGISAVFYYPAGIPLAVAVLLFLVHGHDVSFLSACVRPTANVTDDVILELSHTLGFQMSYYYFCVVAAMLIGVPLLVVCPCFLCTDDYRDRGKAGENLRKRIQSALRRRNRLHESPTASSSADSPSIVFSLPSVAPSTLKPDVTNTVETADDGDAASISVGRVPHTTGPGPSGHARTGTQANAAMSREVPAPAASRIFTRLANIRSRYWRGLRSAFLWVKFKTLGVRFTMAQRTQTTEPRTVEERETKEEKPEYELSKY